MPTHEIRVGCAGWSIPRDHPALFPGDGPHLSRYSGRFPAVEINSSFYRPHRPATYARWASETPDGFAFSLKIPKEITHTRRLVGIDDPLARFLDESSALGPKRGPLLVQLPAEPGVRPRDLSARSSRRSGDSTTAPWPANPATPVGSPPGPTAS